MKFAAFPAITLVLLSACLAAQAELTLDYEVSVQRLPGTDSARVAIAVPAASTKLNRAALVEPGKGSVPRTQIPLRLERIGERYSTSAILPHGEAERFTVVLWYEEPPKISYKGDVTVSSASSAKNHIRVPLKEHVDRRGTKPERGS